MNEKMIKDLEVAVENMEKAKEAVYAFADNIMDEQEDGKETIKQLESVIQSKQEALYSFTDMGELKLARDEVSKLSDELEMQKMVFKAKVNNMRAELEGVLEAFFTANKECRNRFYETDKQLLPNTTLADLKANAKLMRGIANKVSGSVYGVKSVMQDMGVIEETERFYNGHHLNPSAPSSELPKLEQELQTYINLVNKAGYKF